MKIIDRVTNETITFKQFLRLFKNFGFKIFNRNGFKIKLRKNNNINIGE